MHEMQPFERQVADDVVRRVGPTRPVDDLAIFDAVRNEPRGARCASFFDTTRFAVAAVIVVIFGGFLVMALLTNQQRDDGLPAGVVSSPSSSPTQTQTGPGPVPSPQETHVKPRTAIPTAIATASLLATAAPSALAQDAIGGYTFERLAPLAVEKPMMVSDVVRLPNGRIVAFGGGYLPETGGNFQVLHWSSDDDGQTWSRTVQGQRFGSGHTAGIVVHGDRLVAAVSDDAKDRTDTWIYTSADGIDWQQVKRFKNVGARDLISTPDGLALLGDKDREADGWGNRLAPHPTLWLSDDAVEWEAHAISGPPPTRQDADQRYLDALFRAADGTWMVAGTHERFDQETASLFTRPSIFLAGPDLEFAETSFAEGDDGTILALLAHTPAGFLFRAVDTSDGDATSLWTTSDGSDWQLAAQMGSAPSIEEVAVSDAGVIGWQMAVTGAFEDRELLSGSPVYTSPTGASWQYPSSEMMPDVSVANATVMPDGALLIAANDITSCEEWQCAAGPEGPKSPVIIVGTPN